MNSPTFSFLARRRVLISGATGGIGRQLACQCAASRAEIVLQGTNEAKLLGLQNHLETDFQCKAQIEVIDFTDPVATKGLIRNRDLFDFIFLAHGIHSDKPVGTIGEPSELERVLQINYVSVQQILDEVVHRLETTPETIVRAVILTSRAAHGSRNGHSLYSASKAAVNALIMSCNKDKEPNRRLRVSGAEPGIVDTPMIKGRIYDSKEIDSAEDVARHTIETIAPSRDLNGSIRKVGPQHRKVSESIRYMIHDLSHKLLPSKLSILTNRSKGKKLR